MDIYTAICDLCKYVYSKRDSYESLNGVGFKNSFLSKLENKYPSTYTEFTSRFIVADQKTNKPEYGKSFLNIMKHVNSFNENMFNLDIYLLVRDITLLNPSLLNIHISDDQELFNSLCSKHEQLASKFDNIAPFVNTQNRTMDHNNTLENTPSQGLDQTIVQNMIEKNNAILLKQLQELFGPIKQTTNHQTSTTSKPSNFTTTNTTQSQNIEIAEARKTIVLDQFKNIDHDKCRNLIEKMSNLKSHNAISELHLNKGTAPHALFFNNFPRPMFATDARYVEKYNLIIEDFQKTILKLNIDHCKEEIEKHQTELNSYKNSLQIDDLDTYFRACTSLDEYRNADKLRIRFEKHDRLTNNRFKTIDKNNRHKFNHYANQYESQNNSFRSSHSNISNYSNRSNIQQNQSFRSTNSNNSNYNNYSNSQRSSTFGQRVQYGQNSDFRSRYFHRSKNRDY
jgi:hypothetical protein